MSWDIFAQDLPADAKTIEEIPSDFRPKAIGSRAEIVAKILEIAPNAKFQPDLSWGNLDGPGYFIEIGIGKRDPCFSVAFFVRGASPQVINVIADVLDHLKLRALQTGDGDPFFNRTTALRAFQSWQRYRNKVVSGPKGNSGGTSH